MYHTVPNYGNFIPAIPGSFPDWDYLFFFFFCSLLCALSIYVQTAHVMSNPKAVACRKLIVGACFSCCGDIHVEKGGNDQKKKMRN